LCGNCELAFRGRIVKPSRASLQKACELASWSAGVIPYAEMGYWLPDLHDRTIHYTLYPYAAGKPHGQRYNGQQ
jgi:hypothetical protein